MYILFTENEMIGNIKHKFNNKNRPDSIVLIADRTIISEYHGFTDLGYISCFPTNLVPRSIRFISYPIIKKDLFSYSLRRVESKLIDEGYNVITLRPQQIHKIKKIKPKIIGISVVDPISTKPYSWTMRNLLGSTKSVEEEEFSDLLKKINQYRKTLDFRIIIGGPGACEFDRTDKYLDLFDYFE